MGRGGVEGQAVIGKVGVGSERGSHEKCWRAAEGMVDTHVAFKWRSLKQGCGYMSCGCMYDMCGICSVCCHSSFTVDFASQKSHQPPLSLPPPSPSLPFPPCHHPHSPPALPPYCLPPLPFLSPHCLPPLPVLSSSPTISTSLPLLLTACLPLPPPHSQVLHPPAHALRQGQRAAASGHHLHPQHLAMVQQNQRRIPLPLPPR